MTNERVSSHRGNTAALWIASRLALALLPLSLGACELLKSIQDPGTVVDANWWTMQGGLERTGALPGPALALPLALKWQRDVAGVPPHAVGTPPVLGADVVVFGFESNPPGLHALALADGSPRWSYAAPDSFFRGAPAIASGRVYAASFGAEEPGAVHALDLESGQLRWKTQIGAAVVDAVAVAYASVFVRTRDARVLALHQDDGALAWTSAPAAGPGPQDCAPVVAFGRIYACFEDGVHAFDVANGARVWKYALADAPEFASLAAQAAVALQTPARLLVATSRGEIHALHAATGTRLWTSAAAATTELASTLLVGDRRAWSRHGARLRRIDTDDGSVLATLDLPEFPFAWPPGALVRDTLFLADAHALRAYAADTLAPRWNADGLGGPNVVCNGLAAGPSPLVVIHGSRVRAYAAH